MPWPQVGVDLELVVGEQNRRKQAPGKGVIQPKGRRPVSEVCAASLGCQAQRPSPLWRLQAGRCCKECLGAQVLLVGGATRMEGVRQLVRNMTGLDAREFVVDPDEVTALNGLGVSCSSKLSAYRGHSARLRTLAN